MAQLNQKSLTLLWVSALIGSRRQQSAPASLFRAKRQTSNDYSTFGKQKFIVL